LDTDAELFKEASSFSDKFFCLPSSLKDYFFKLSEFLDILVFLLEAIYPCSKSDEGLIELKSLLKRPSLCRIDP
jgi:hypothetical protein